jgi:hypothetical protein
MPFALPKVRPADMETLLCVPGWILKPDVELMHANTDAETRSL